MPIDVAISQGKIDAEDWSELEAALVFFTCHVMPAKKVDRMGIAKATASVAGGSITSSTPMDLAASLQTSTKGVPTASQASLPQPSDTSPAKAFPI